MALAGLLVAACTRPTAVESMFAVESARGQSFTHVLVIGVSPDYNTRCRFERLMQDSLQSDATRVTTSCSQMTSKTPLTRETVVEVVKALGTDAVLATRLVDGKARLEKGGTEEARGEAYFKPTGIDYAFDPYYGAFGLPVVYADFVAEQPALTMRRTVTVESNLYRVSDAAMVYTVDAVTYDKETPFAVIDDITTVTANKLRRDGLVR
jgi:hypothetical protein